MRYDLKTLEFSKVISILKEYCFSNLARTTLDSLKPAETFGEVKELLKETEEAYEAIIRYDIIPRMELKSIPESIARAKIGGILNEEELLDILGLFDVTNQIIRYFSTLSGMNLSFQANQKYLDMLAVSKTLKSAIELAISNEGIVVDTASKQLLTIRRSLSSLESKLRSKMNELLITKQSMLTENLIVIRDGRMCLPVKIEYKNTIRGIVHDISSSNTTCYIEPDMAVELANQMESYRAEERKEVEVILKGLSLMVSAEAEQLERNVLAIVDLDIIYAKGLMAKELGYNPVSVREGNYFNLKKAKHPLIKKEVVVPIDIELGRKYDTVIITGPNTGGKTVALKTVGLLHLMVYCGMMVPADSASEFAYFDGIYADIGDEQSIEQSLSTFSSHMKKIIEITQNATMHSLILLDELGSGTDPKEGSSLAIAIIKYFRNLKCSIICTTHYSELKTFAYHEDGVCNASVEFDIHTLMPTYRLLLGIPGKSNAIEIASKLGLAEEIVKESSQRSNADLSPSSSLLKNLEEEMTNIRAKNTALEHKMITYNDMLLSLEKERADLAKKTDSIIFKAKQEAKRILSQAQNEAEELLNEINKMKDTSFKEHELADIKHKVRNLKVEDSMFQEGNYDLKVGDYVYIPSYEKYGTITKIHKDKYVVSVGQFQIDFDKKELVLSTRPKEIKQKPTRLSGYNPASHAELSLDLRGKRYEEVSYLLDQYIDQAILGNLESVTIIHGFGTGAVRKAVLEYLKNCPYVKSYRYGKEGEGLNGVTVVYLK